MRDSEPVEAGEWSRALPVGGTYTFVAKLKDREVWSETVTVGNDSDTRTVDVAVRHFDQAESGARTSSSSDVVGGGAVNATSHSSAVIATIGAVALLGGALAFDLWGNSTDSDAIAMNSMDLLSSANNERYAAEGLLVAGLACGGIATYLWLHHDDEAPARVARRTFVQPVASSRFAGVGLMGSW